MRLTVILLTYNHEKFIAQAVNSILMQEVNFNYEIIIIEDCSTDKTRDILLNFKKEYSDRIKLVLAEANENDNRAWIEAMQSAKGEYIALLDGDDYWTSPHKLEKQLNFLDNHPNCSICFHNVDVVYNDSNLETHPFHLRDSKFRISRPIPEPISKLKDIVELGNFIQTCSVMFRSGFLNEIPEWYKDFPVGDWPVHIFNARFGDIGYINEVLAVYRVHQSGVWSLQLSKTSELDNVQKMITACETIESYLRSELSYSLKMKPLIYYYSKAMKIAYQAKNYKETIHYAKRYLSQLSFAEKISCYHIPTLILKSYLKEALATLSFACFHIKI